MHLSNHSWFSLRYGTLSIENLVEEALQNNVEALALTDINNSMGMIDFVKSCRENKIKPIAGIEFRNDDELLYTGIAVNNKGFRELNELVSFHNKKAINFSYSAPILDQVLFLYPFSAKNPENLLENEFIGIRPSEVSKLHFSDLKRHLSKLVIQNTTTFRNDNDYLLHRNLRAIDKNLLLSRLTAKQLALSTERMLTSRKLAELFADFPEVIKNTEKVIEKCSIDFDFNSIKNKKHFTGKPYDDKLLLENWHSMAWITVMAEKTKKQKSVSGMNWKLLINLDFHLIF